MIAFVIAMDNEAKCVLSHFSNPIESKCFGRRVVRGVIEGEECAVVVSGVGKSNAAAAAQLALGLGEVEALVNVGVAGGLKRAMKVGEIYRVSSAVEYDFDLSQINNTDVGTLNEYTSRYLPLAAAGDFAAEILGTGDRFNDSAEDFRFLTADVGAGLRDMEGGAVAHVALRAEMPVYSFKAISDVAGAGSTVEQYLQNLEVALEALQQAVPAIVREVVAGKKGNGRE